MVFNYIKYKPQNNNIEITANILSSMAEDAKIFKFIEIKICF